MALEIDRIRDAAERAARTAGVEVVDVEWKVGRERLLRVFIDKPFDRGGQPPFDAQGSGVEVGHDANREIGVPGRERFDVRRVSQGGQERHEGVSHTDCQAVSEQLSVLLDVEELVPGPPYVLEVSSPGLDRKLTRAAEFERFAGRLARITMSEPVGVKSFFEGRLAGYADGLVKMDVQGQVVELPLDGIRKAQLVVEF